jgi:RimJ/RimL family protein N-acetyltransferase
MMETLETKRLLLKPTDLIHANDYQKYFSDPEVLALLSTSLPRPYPADGAHEYISKIIKPQQGLSLWHWGIFIKSQPERYVGSIELRKKPTEGHRGFWLARKFWGRGYMSEAVREVTRYAFESLNFEEMILQSDLKNTASERIKASQGAVLIGQRSEKNHDGELKMYNIWKLEKNTFLNKR